MTPEEARDELRRRFNGTVVAKVESWYFNSSKKETTSYTITYNFQGLECSSKTENSFEECFAQLDFDDQEANKVISKYSILLRKF